MIKDFNDIWIFNHFQCLLTFCPILIFFTETRNAKSNEDLNTFFFNKGFLYWKVSKIWPFFYLCIHCSLTSFCMATVVKQVFIKWQKIGQISILGKFAHMKIFVNVKIWVCNFYSHFIFRAFCLPNTTDTFSKQDICFKFLLSYLNIFKYLTVLSHF